MKITDHATKQLQIRFGITQDVENEIAFRTQHSKLLSPIQVNRCGTKYRIGFTYLRYRDMILVYKQDTLINALYYYNPYRMLKRETQSANQGCRESRGQVAGSEI